MKYKVPFIKPLFPSSEVIADDYRQIVESNWFTNFGPFEREFSERASEYIGGEGFVSTVSNATLGLLIAIKILLKNPRGHVLIPSFTFSAGPEMIIMSGFKPVFIDIQPDTWQPDIIQAESYIKSNHGQMSGIILCNIFGVGNKSIEKWEELSLKYNLPLIIDSAAGFGSSYTDNERVGLRGNCEVFSLHATKPFAVGEGGLISSRSKDFIERVKQFQNFGFDNNKKINSIGINAKMQEFNAAIGLRQLQDFDARLKSRTVSLERYRRNLEPLGFVFQDNDNLSTIPFVSVVVQNKELSDLILTELNKSSVEVRKYYEPLHYQQVLMSESVLAGSLSVTEDVYSRILSLPLHDDMDKASIDMITNIMRRLYEEYKS